MSSRAPAPPLVKALLQIKARDGSLLLAALLFASSSLATLPPPSPQPSTRLAGPPRCRRQQSAAAISATLLPLPPPSPSCYSSFAALSHPPLLTPNCPAFLHLAAPCCVLVALPLSLFAPPPPPPLCPLDSSEVGCACA